MELFRILTLRGQALSAAIKEYTMKRSTILVQSAQTELAEHEVALGLDHLRAAATRYESMGDYTRAQRIRKHIESVRQEVVG